MRRQKVEVSGLVVAATLIACALGAPARLSAEPPVAAAPNAQSEFVGPVCPYKLQVGDVVRLQSLADENLNKDLLVLPNGSVELRLLVSVRAEGQTVEQLQGNLEQRYQKYYKTPAIKLTPVKVNRRLEDFASSVSALPHDHHKLQVGDVIRLQSLADENLNRDLLVLPDGSVNLRALGPVLTDGRTVEQFQETLEKRYQKYYPTPAIKLTLLKVPTQQSDLMRGVR